MQWSQLPERRRDRYWPLITPTLHFAMNTCVLHQRFLRESEKTLQPQTSRAKEVVGHGTKVGIGGGVMDARHARICLRTEPSCGVPSERERIGAYERRPTRRFDSA